MAAITVCSDFSTGETSGIKRKHARAHTHTQNFCVRLNTKAAIKQGVLGTSGFVVLLNEFCDFQ